MCIPGGHGGKTGSTTTPKQVAHISQRDVLDCHQLAVCSVPHQLSRAKSARPQLLDLHWAARQRSQKDATHKAAGWSGACAHAQPVCSLAYPLIPRAVVQGTLRHGCWVVHSPQSVGRKEQVGRVWRRRQVVAAANPCAISGVRARMFVIGRCSAAQPLRRKPAGPHQVGILGREAGGPREARCEFC